ncbi:MAG: acyl-CoA dehydrogenase family protein [Actinobacteria bacterium]|nr:acyl-CoA dehydrogenase family protein [Actinomycetota bacterium]
MDFAYAPEDEAFRAELRAWLEDNVPKFFAEFGEEGADAEGDGDDDGGPAGAGGIMGAMDRRKAWQRRLNEGRWAAITWPSEWNGRDATVTQSVIYSEEMARAKAPGIFNANGLWQIGPMIIRWGTDEQKDRWLPTILDASTHWCQGFSEPEAGSDLANLRTMAMLDEKNQEYVLNGQKTWITSAQVADWGLFLVRTDPGALERGAKHEGITAMIIDMHTPGVECRPIRDIAGDWMFNEVWFTDARIPVANRLGEENAGWQVAMGTLGHERVGTAGLAIAMKADLQSMIASARAVNPTALQDPELRERIARAHTQIEFTRLLNYRALSKILRGEPNWPEVPIAKLQWSYLAQTLAELAVDLLGPAGMMAKGAPDAVDNGTWNRLYVFQRYTSIGAGTTEVQKNIIADRAIKLPRR